MGYKVFVSYKFYDYDVRALPNTFGQTLPGNYVHYLETTILPATNSIYKGEHQDEDLSDYSDDYIWRHLKDKIYDSSITIVMISPNMKEPYRQQRSQWIPREIQYSLWETARNDRVSHNNAILGVILPDAFGRYSYFDRESTFPILRDNIINGYIFTVNWDVFLKSPEVYLEIAKLCRDETPSYKLVKTL